MVQETDEAINLDYLDKNDPKTSGLSLELEQFSITPRVQEIVGHFGSEIKNVANAKEKKPAPKSPLDRLIRTLETERWSHDFFKDIIRILTGTEPVDLFVTALEQQYILDTMRKHPYIHEQLLEYLHTNGKLKQVPEIFWKIDRTPEQYNERLGFDVSKAVEDFAVPGVRKSVVEFGQGEGLFRKSNFDRGLQLNYVDVSISDNHYYSLSTVIQNSLSFEKLEDDIQVSLTAEQRAQLCDILYKTLVIDSVNSEQHSVTYDSSVRDAIEEDPASIIDMMQRKAESIDLQGTVPSSSHGMRATKHGDLEPFYPHPLHLSELCPALRLALEAIKKSPKKYVPSLLSSESIFSRMGGYTPGSILSDFQDVENFHDGNIYIGLGIRSTVYKKGEQYSTLLETLGRKLDNDGILFDDSVRENFGTSYRISELQDVQKATGIPIHIVMGPGVKGEDYAEGKVVPLALVMTSSVQKIEYLQKNMFSGYRLVPLEDFSVQGPHTQGKYIMDSLTLSV